MRHAAVADQVGPLISAGLIATCAPLDFEALYSARDPREYEMQRNDRRAAYEYLPTSDEDWQRVFEVQGALTKVSRWRDVGVPDRLVAAIAERQGVTLLHYDADFDTIRQVTRQDTRWVVPRGSVP